MRNDQVDRLTRIVAINVVIAVGSAFVLLYGFPDQTTRLWAWTIKPPMTPMLMGSSSRCSCSRNGPSTPGRGS